jgi:hypothetical protein
MGSFRSGVVYRYPSQRDGGSQFVEGLPNYFFETHLDGAAIPLLEKGISQIAPPRSRASEIAFPAIIMELLTYGTYRRQVTLKRGDSV